VLFFALNVGFVGCVVLHVGVGEMSRFEVSLVEGGIADWRVMRLLSEKKAQRGGGVHSHALFLGQVSRGDEQDSFSSSTARAVRSMEFSLTKDTREKLLSLCESTLESFSSRGVKQVHFVHSTGSVPAGEYCSLVFVCGLHHDGALAALNELIEKHRKLAPLNRDFTYV